MALRGTSFAAPQETRWAENALRQTQAAGSPDLRKVATPKSLKAQAETRDEKERAAGHYPADPVAPKVGSGRMLPRRHRADHG